MWRGADFIDEDIHCLQLLNIDGFLEVLANKGFIVNLEYDDGWDGDEDYVTAVFRASVTVCGHPDKFDSIYDEYVRKLEYYGFDVLSYRAAVGNDKCYVVYSDLDIDCEITLILYSYFDTDILFECNADHILDIVLRSDTLDVNKKAECAVLVASILPNRRKIVEHKELLKSTLDSAGLGFMFSAVTGGSDKSYVEFKQLCRAAGRPLKVDTKSEVAEDIKVDTVTDAEDAEDVNIDIEFWNWCANNAPKALLKEAYIPLKKSLYNIFIQNREDIEIW